MLKFPLIGILLLILDLKLCKEIIEIISGHSINHSTLHKMKFIFICQSDIYFWNLYNCIHTKHTKPRENINYRCTPIS